MSMIFPGMDPYLEEPLMWPDVHASFIVYLREHLRPLLRPRYVIAVESRVFVEGPDTDLRSSPMRGCGRLDLRYPVTLALRWKPTRQSKSKSHPWRSRRRMSRFVIVSPANGL